MSSRRDARRAAIDVMFQADVTGTDPVAALDEWERLRGPVADFTRALVEGTAGRLLEIDRLLEARAQDWRVDRMPALDRTILRVATFELIGRPDVPLAAVIDEAVEAANQLSTQDSGRFVNGVLGAIARNLPEGSRS